jgi:hypothetical protein
VFGESGCDFSTLTSLKRKHMAYYEDEDLKTFLFLWQNHLGSGFRAHRHR